MAEQTDFQELQREFSEFQRKHDAEFANLEERLSSMENALRTGIKNALRDGFAMIQAINDGWNQLALEVSQASQTQVHTTQAHSHGQDCNVRDSGTFNTVSDLDCMTEIGEIELPLVPTPVSITQNFVLATKPPLDQELEATNHNIHLGSSKEIDEVKLENSYILENQKNELVFEEDQMKIQE